MNLIIAVRDTEGQAKLFVQTLLYGLLAWGELDAASGDGGVVAGGAAAGDDDASMSVGAPALCIADCGAVWRPFAAATRPAMFRDTSAMSFFHRFALSHPLWRIRRIVHAGDGVDVHPAEQAATGSCRARATALRHHGIARAAS